MREIFILFLFIYATYQLCCPDGTLVYGKNCYHLVLEKEDWNSTAVKCIARFPGSTLLNFQSEAEFAQVRVWLPWQQNIWVQSALRPPEDEFNPKQKKKKRPTTLRGPQPKKCPAFYNNAKKGVFRMYSCTKKNFYICEEPAKEQC